MTDREEYADEHWLEDEELSDDETRARKQRLLRKAFENMGMGPRQTTPAPGAPRQVTPFPAAPPAQPLAPSPLQPSGNAASPSPDDELARLINEKAAAIATQDHFARLGVSRAASREQVKNAFFAQAKVFHPDRLPQSLSALQPKVRDVFAALRDAYELLQDDTRRRAYVQELVAGLPAARPRTPPPRRPEDAAIHLKHAELAMRRKAWPDAEKGFARAYALTGLADHLALQAWAVFLDPERKAELPAVKALLGQALLKDPRCERALYSLGVIARVEGDMAGAEKQFRAALGINPRHIEASSELRLIELRKNRKR